MDVEKADERPSRKEPYARAREGDATTEVLLEHALAFGGEVIEFQALARVLRRETNRYSWQRLIARRASAIAVTTRRIASLLGDRYIGRYGGPEQGEWLIVARADDGGDYVVATIRSPSSRTWEDLARPLVVRLIGRTIDEAMLRIVCHS